MSNLFVFIPILLANSTPYFVNPNLKPNLSIKSLLFDGEISSIKLLSFDNSINLRHPSVISVRSKLKIFATSFVDLVYFYKFAP